MARSSQSEVVEWELLAISKITCVIKNGSGKNKDFYGFKS